MSQATQAKSKPIFFNAEMIQSIIDGKKTTARIKVKSLITDDDAENIKICYDWQICDNYEVWCLVAGDMGYEPLSFKCPYGQIGDELWIKESFTLNPSPEASFGDAIRGKDMTVTYSNGDTKRFKAGDITFQGPNGVIRVSCAPLEHEFDVDVWGIKRSPICMPKEIARISLEIKSIHIERLNDISEEKAIEEGVKRELNGFKDYTNPNITKEKAKDSFKTFWEYTYGQDSWDENPFVWVIEFVPITS